ncbi:probable phospholipid-transporting ATPase 4 [Helianthus annuus]|uniref:probable phospholipid-transporting ATPase 4 n=1 Tax=Helianthus annuus TaxID=4232 RepID=UPI001652D60C|nr:probable phospholipid-transporting ATPase 4 [Helianthus annuus]
MVVVVRSSIERGGVTGIPAPTVSLQNVTSLYSIIFDRLSKNGRLYEEATKKHLNEYAEAGLRTLAFAYRKLDISEYSSWNGEFSKAKTSIGGERDTMLEHLSDIMEKDLILVGATAVEDKLQQGVPQCIDKLAQAGLKLWVLTGDKMETAINIGFACSLLRQGMKQIRITTNVDHTSNMVIVHHHQMKASETRSSSTFISCNFCSKHNFPKNRF